MENIIEKIKEIDGDEGGITYANEGIPYISRKDIYSLKNTPLTFGFDVAHKNSADKMSTHRECSNAVRKLYNTIKTLIKAEKMYENKT